MECSFLPKREGSILKADDVVTNFVLPIKLGKQTSRDREKNNSIDRGFSSSKNRQRGRDSAFIASCQEGQAASKTSSFK